MTDSTSESCYETMDIPANEALTLQVPLDTRFFLKNEFRIDRLLDFADWSSPAQAEDVRAAIELMVPVGCNHQLIRVGGNGDGAYLVPDDLREIDACFSPGVSDIITFESQLARDYGIPSYLCDASVDPAKLDLDPTMQFFSARWLGSFDGEDTQSLDRWVLESNHADSDQLILQMDIEGAEYNCLLAASDSILSRFRIIVVELHMLPILQSSRFLNTRFLPVMHKLLRHLDCIHAHANNCLSPVDLYGYRVPQVIELTFYRKRENHGRAIPWAPSPLDIVNVPGKPSLSLTAPWT